MTGVSDQLDTRVAIPGEWVFHAASGGYVAIRRTGLARRELRERNRDYWMREITAWDRMRTNHIEIDAEPRQPPGLFIDGDQWGISYASTDGWRSCLIAPQRHIGIDTETQREYPDIEAMLVQAGASASMKSAAYAFGWRLSQQFARVWTAKEAVLKALGTGLQIDPRIVEIRSVTRDGCRCAISITQGTVHTNRSVRAIGLILHGTFHGCDAMTQSRRSRHRQTNSRIENIDS